jgi:threonine/homoserine/homoserine lactone efflux protein
MTSALALSVVKYVGAAYLIYLGAAIMAKPYDPTLPKVAPIRAWRAFFEAIPAEVLNPKTALFSWLFCPSSFGLKQVLASLNSLFLASSS